MLGEVLYDFVAEGDDELSITAGECLRIAPKQRQPRIRGWLLATVDGNSKGIVPANYIKVGSPQRYSDSQWVLNVCAYEPREVLGNNWLITPTIYQKWTLRVRP